MPLSITINGVTYNVGFSLNVGFSPPNDKIVGITYRKGRGMAALLGSVVYSSTPPGLTSRRVTVTFASGAPSITYDALPADATFPVNEGDTGNVTSVAVNASGEAPASDPFNFTATIGGGGGGVPPKDVITGVNFRPAT